MPVRLLCRRHRLVEGIGRLVADHGRRGLVRDAVVVVLSDGWGAAPVYAPLGGGTAAALPW